MRGLQLAGLGASPGVVRALQRLYRETPEHGRVADLRDAMSRTTTSRARGDGGLLSQTGNNGCAAPPRTSSSVTVWSGVLREAATAAASRYRDRTPSGIFCVKGAYRAFSPASYMRCCTASGIARSLAASSTCAARDGDAGESAGARDDWCVSRSVDGRRKWAWRAGADFLGR